jgi:hypothetical protein
LKGLLVDPIGGSGSWVAECGFIHLSNEVLGRWWGAEAEEEYRAGSAGGVDQGAPFQLTWVLAISGSFLVIVMGTQLGVGCFFGA